jgi:ADP-dependent NAD(P)H-hydrate dehydratase / NAD(P)H-hydrate epimerase
MKVATAAQMRQIDEQTSREFGITSSELMENAGRAVADLARETYAPGRVCVVCGKGNNAGDGFVAARWLKANTVDVDVVLLADPGGLTGAAAEAYQRMLGAGITPLPHVELENCLKEAHLAIDALLGTGIRGPATGEIAEAIAALNRSPVPVVSVDVPSGLRELAPGEDHGPVVNAEMTITIGLPKVALLDAAGFERAGEIAVAPINFPRALLESDELKLNWASRAELASWLPERPSVSHKGTYGSVGFVAGSAPYAGAAILAARAALRAGCGLAYIFTTEELNPIYKAALPEAVTSIVPSKTGQWLDASSTEAILNAAQTMTVLAVGPGIGISHGHAEMVCDLVGGSKKGMVLDADALTCLCHPATLDMFPGEKGRKPRGEQPLHVNVLRGRGNIVLTPHPGEMARMTGATTKEVQSQRLTVAQGFADEYGTPLLLKGASTVIALPEGQAYINPGATSALAKGGSGDVLTGLIASLMAQGVEPGKAAILGAYVHLEAGRMCADRVGVRGVLAGEVADAIPLVMREMERV